MRLLVFRFSALGDIALSVPVIQKVKEQHPNLEITVVSRPFAAPLFSAINVDFHAVKLDNYKGFAGLYRLFKELKKTYKPDIVIDLHDVLRTKVLRNLFTLSGTHSFKIDKGRKEKKAITRKEKKDFRVLKHTTERYSEVFSKAGIKVSFNTQDAIKLNYPFKTDFKDLSNLNTHHKKIGIAPFAFHKGKMWPIEKVKTLIESLLGDGHFIFLFGGPNEEEKLNQLVDSNSKIVNLAGQFNLGDEINLMKQLNVILAMDSSNMHLATLASVPVVSIWGATHINTGFGPLSGNDQNIVEISTTELDCRPCSVFGNQPCFRGDYACLNGISVEMVREKINAVLR